MRGSVLVVRCENDVYTYMRVDRIINCGLKRKGHRKTSKSISVEYLYGWTEWLWWEGRAPAY